MVFLSEMRGVNRVGYRRNRRDNYLVSETVSQLCNINLKGRPTTKSLFAGEAATASHADD